MTIAFTFQKSPKLKADTAVATVYKDSRLSAAGAALDTRLGGAIKDALGGEKKFTGKAGQVFTLTLPKNSPYRRVVLLGLGDVAKLDTAAFETAGGRLYAALAAMGAEIVRVYLGARTGRKKPEAAEAAAHMALGFKLRSYKFDKYKTKSKDEAGEPGLSACEFLLDAAAKAGKAYQGLDAVAQGVFFARDLVNEPPNALYPDSMAMRLKETLAPLGVEVEIFDEKKMEKLGFGAHLAVGMGSAHKPRVVIMRWQGGKKPAKGKTPKAPLAFVGKGVTFDTGGFNIKPTGGMEEMKLDMSGAAVVGGLMMTLALRKSKAPVVGIAGLAENMVSGAAYRPSDILKSLSGKTIEVMNTDAEGRLVLADCLTYVQRTYNPKLVVDLATLTGAMMVALGSEYCGTFVNDNTLWRQLDKASKESGEKLWRMPLDEVFKKDMVGKTADVQSLGGMGRYAGACTAAGFLEHFIEGGRPWAHLDIAGTAWIKGDTATCPKPATGFGVRVLDRLIAGSYE